MKCLRIAYAKLVMLEVEDDFTEKDASALIEDIAEDEIFRDGVDWDDVEWELDQAEEN